MTKRDAVIESVCRRLLEGDEEQPIHDEPLYRALYYYITRSQQPTPDVAKQIVEALRSGDVPYIAPPAPCTIYRGMQLPSSRLAGLLGVDEVPPDGVYRVRLKISPRRGTTVTSWSRDPAEARHSSSAIRSTVTGQPNYSVILAAEVGYPPGATLDASRIIAEDPSLSWYSKEDEVIALEPITTTHVAVRRL